MGKGALLNLDGAARFYGEGENRVDALLSTDLTVEEGEFICVAGPSGSGKTTLLNLSGLLDLPSSGRVLVLGRDSGALSKGARASLRRELVGFVFQAHNLLPVLTARENVEYSMLVRGLGAKERSERAQSALTSVGLLGKEDKFPRELSGGEQQRVAVARAIAPGTPLVIADEPTANLDSVTGKALMSLLYELKEREGMTFIFSSHDPMVMECAERVITLHDGSIVKDNTK
ncbi:MAG: macrolide ABC transporter ATP-binding protein [Deltaproteobacteria bacterium]|nr:MAG: macrolide ABC transporter ATP-binding protein [Deltaproteobacteria bacterium]